MFPPEFIQRLQPCHAIEGDEVRFECTFKGDPKPFISWYRENEKINPNNLFTIITDLKNNKSTLIIRRVAFLSSPNSMKSINSVLYRVVAENSLGLAECSASLFVVARGSPNPSILSSISPQQEAKVALRVDSANYGPSGAVNRSKGTEEDCIEHQHQHYVQLVQPAVLIIQLVDEISDLDNRRQLQQVEDLNSQKAPKFLTQLESYVERSEGQSLHLECHLCPDVESDLKTEWFFNGQQLVTGSRFHTIDDFGLVVLDIDWLYPRDSGEYICKASNRYGSDVTRTLLRVKPDKTVVQESQLKDPKVVDQLRQLEYPDVRVEADRVSSVETSMKAAQFVQPLTCLTNKMHFMEGDSLHLEARVWPINDEEITVEWFHNGEPLISGHRFRPTFEFDHIKLDILYLYPEDTGTYTCVIKNSEGSDRSEYKLDVTGKPSLDYQTQLPAEMLAGVRRLTEMEAQWDKLSESIDGERSTYAPNHPQLDKGKNESLRAGSRESATTVNLFQQKSQQLSPKFISHIQDYIERKEGDSLHLECCLGPVDDPDLKTEWFFNGRPLVTGSRFHTIDDFGFIVLDIDWLFPRDTGEYVCKATNKHGTDITRTVLRVKPDKSVELDSQLDNPEIIDKLRQLEFPDVEEEPPVAGEPDKPARFVQQLRTNGNKSEFVEGENVHFEARVAPATDGELTVEWFHNNQALISGHRFKPTFDFGHIVLDILYLYPEDSGLYKCVARNATGADLSQFEIKVAGKPSLVYQSQLPKEMIGGVQKITEMEAQWNKPIEEEEEVEVKEKCPPEFVLKPKAYTAFEGSCARFCCRIMANPRPRITWVLNGQSVVTGSRYKLTYDGMYHLTIPKCQISDAGKVEVHAKNLLGECFATTELKVRKKVDDYRGVLKNSPNPWYDQQSLKVYQRHRSSQELSDDEDFLQQFQQLKLKQATEQQMSSPIGNELIGYMEPGTPDVNLLLANSSTTTQSPLLEPGDLHPVVVEQQVVMAPAPSTIQRALEGKDNVSSASEIKTFQADSLQQSPKEYSNAAQTQPERRVFGLSPARLVKPKMPSTTSSAATSGFQQHNKQHQHASWMSQLLPSTSGSTLSSQRQLEQLDDKQIKTKQSQTDLEWQLDQADYASDAEVNRIRKAQAGSSSALNVKPPPSSPESKVHGKEVHSETHKQVQVERHFNKEIKREIIEKDIFEQEHSGTTRENLVRGDSLERRPSTPTNERNLRLELQQNQLSDQQELLIDDHRFPPEFSDKIQPCRALDGQEARFQCSFRGQPTPTITWYRDGKLIKSSNLYTIETSGDSSTLVIKRVQLNCNAVFTVKAENVAGSAKSSANLVVEQLDRALQQGQDLGSIDMRLKQQVTVVSSAAPQSSKVATAGSNDELSLDSSLSDSQASGHKKVRSVKTRKLGVDELRKLVRASPEGLIAPTFLHTLRDTVSKPGQLVRLDARLTGSQPMEVKWLKDGERIRPDSSHKLILEGDLYTLLILECAANDEGFYECHALNRIGEAYCGASLLVSLEAPKTGVQVESPGRNSSLGEQAYQQARNSSAQTHSSEVTTSLQPERIPEANQRKQFGITKHYYQNPLMDQYTKGASRSDNILSLIKGLDNHQVREGKSVTLRCQISSFPIAEVHWFKDESKLIKPSKYFRIYKDNDETYCMKILEAFPEDQGEYKCIARSPNGKITVETKAYINVLPN